MERYKDALKPIAEKVKCQRLRVGNGFFLKGTTVYRCPSCMCLISRYFHYCAYCGQELDWRKDNAQT